MSPARLVHVAIGIGNDPAADPLRRRMGRHYKTTVFGVGSLKELRVIQSLSHQHGEAAFSRL
jgi:hypothetical protein